MAAPEYNVGRTLQVFSNYSCMNQNVYLRNCPPAAVWVMDGDLGDGRMEQNWKLRQETCM